MKRSAKLLIAALLFLPNTAQKLFATAQEGNIIYIDGERWDVLAEPIYADTALFHRMKAALPKDRSWSTANWNGYTSYWSIKQDCLFLDSIGMSFYIKDTNQYRSECLDENTMQRLFSGYTKREGILAAWYTNDLRIARGKCVRYVHSGYDSNFEYETFLSIDKGRLVSSKDYHNKVIDGLSFGERGIQKQEDIKTKFHLHPEKYPELTGVKRILFSIKNASVDSLGNITDCTVTARIWHGEQSEYHQGIAEEMKQAIMAIHPWKVLFLYGEYVPYELNGYSFRYDLAQTFGVSKEYIKGHYSAKSKYNIEEILKRKYKESMARDSTNTEAPMCPPNN